eukprot:403369977
MVEQVEETFKFVGLVDKSYQVKTAPIPKPGPGEVLIRIAYSTINPVDKYTFYTFTQPRVGSDGCGTIVALGEGVNPELNGKKVAFTYEAWGQYKLAKPEGLVILDDSQDLSKAANAIVNPLTVIGQLDIVKKQKSTSCIMMAASSQLAKQFLKLSQEEGIEVINIVRKDEQVKILKEELNAKYVLNQTSETFFEDLQALINQLHPKVMFEYVSGDLPGKIFAVMEAGSHLVVVGNLSGETLNLNSGNIIFSNKTVRGFLLTPYLKELTEEERQAAYKRLADDLRDGGKIFGTQIVKEISFEQFQEGMAERAAVATEGKILINCQ